MPRNGSGTSTVINTFVIDTIADPDEVNANFDDVADQLTNSLPRDGQAGMNAPLPLQNGTAALPSLTFSSDPDTGVYRSAANKVGIAAGGTESAVFTSNGVEDTVTICDPSDNTKKVRVDAGAIATATTRVMSVPDRDINISAVPKGYIYGLTLSNNVADPTNDMDIAAGEAADEGATPWIIILASTLTKRLDAAWAVGTGNGGLDTGAVGNNVYYVWLIQRSDTGIVDALFSLSSTSPTMPANYDRKRVIGSFARVSGVNQASRSYSQKEPTAWVSYTPTLTGVGTATGVVCRSRRVGSNLEVEATWTNGTTTAVDFAMSMGAYGTDANVVCDSVWNTRRPIIGVAIWQVSSAAALYVIGQGSFNQVNISISSAGRDGFTPVTGATLGTGTPIGVRYSVPIQGWN